jgi:hypothetical protein
VVAKVGLEVSGFAVDHGQVSSMAVPSGLGLCGSLLRMTGWKGALKIP